MIEKIKQYKDIVINLIKLSMPILMGNIAQILVSFADNIVAGRYSTLALGAISVASAIVMTVTIGAIGFVLSVSPVISNQRGKNIPSKKYFKLTILFAFVVSIPFFLILEILLNRIDFIGLAPDLVEPVREYISICAWSVFPATVFVALKEFLQAYEKVVFANILMLLMVILNVILNISLTFGCEFLHIKAMGIVGLSIATLLSKTLITLFMLIYCIPLFKMPYEYSKNYIKELIKIGAPISASIFFEFMGFNLTAILIGKFSALYAGVHNIILCIANFTFMIVLSISNAASVKIGYYNGRKDIVNIKRYSVINIVLVLIVCFTTFSALSLYSREIISLFSLDSEVLRLSLKILKIAMCFLFFDGIQGACVGILKGLKDTKIIMYAMLSAYLIIAIPIGSYLAFIKGIVLEGYWFALALALFFVAVVTSIRVIFDIKKIKQNY